MIKFYGVSSKTMYFEWGNEGKVWESSTSYAIIQIITVRVMRSLLYFQDWKQFSIVTNRIRTMTVHVSQHNVCNKLKRFRFLNRDLIYCSTVDGHRPAHTSQFRSAQSKRLRTPDKTWYSLQRVMTYSVQRSTSKLRLTQDKMAREKIRVIRYFELMLKPGPKLKIKHEDTPALG